MTECLEHSGEGLPGVVRTARGEERLTYDAVGRVEESTVVALAGGMGDLWRPVSRTWAYNGAAVPFEV
ncbi:MAG: hypothetical protein EA398_00765 [Deltaproteobacteria bacterium]|nr:MAG: hypothetical protein EA398_00765 [Deltaproteobacteria bacterium]